MKNKILTIIFGLTLFAAAPVWAEQYHIKEMTPEVRSALDARKGRYEQLRDLKSKGAVGENNKGYVEVVGSDSSAQGIVDAENKDRRFIYKTIMEQNNLPGDALSTVEEVFAQVQRDKASSGDKIQEANGSWVSK
jgi:uncharacterized protein YdbL (DUF1318 family)